MVEFGGWEMPVEYSGIIEEHVAVRTRAGLFDVSHMGEIQVRGPEALSLLQFVTSNDVARLKTGQAQYSALMYAQGSAVDDCLVHRLGEGHYLLCVNASNTDKGFDWITRQNVQFGADVRNVSADYAQLALQGPLAATILAKVSPSDLAAIQYYWFTWGECCGVEGWLARTGACTVGFSDDLITTSGCTNRWAIRPRRRYIEGSVPRGPDVGVARDRRFLV